MSDRRHSRSIAATNSALTSVVLLSLTATALSGYLWFQSARLHAQGLVGPLPGCADTELISCGEVLASRYSQWLGIPLAAVGTINYVLLLGSAVGLLMAGSRRTPRFLWTAALTLAGLGTFCGLWLVIVQAFFLHRYCLFCDLAHACGLVSLLVLAVYRPKDLPGTLRVASGGVALAGALGLALGQMLLRPEAIVATVVVQPPATQPIGLTALTSQPGSDSQPAAATQIAELRPANYFKVTDAAGTVIATLDLDSEIVLGDPKAERTLVEFMDFGCHECRQEFGLMQEIWKKYPHWFRIVVLLFPGNKECNAYSTRERPNVCEVAQAAVAVLKRSPEHYSDIHAMFFKLQNTPLTGGMAWQLVKQMCNLDDAALQSWQEDPMLLDKIKRHTDLVHAILVGQKVTKTVSLPGLFANGKLLNGAAETVDQLEKHLTQLLGPPSGGAPATTQPAIAGTPASPPAASPAG